SIAPMRRCQPACALCNGNSTRRVARELLRTAWGRTIGTMEVSLVNNSKHDQFLSLEDLDLVVGGVDASAQAAPPVASVSMGAVNVGSVAGARGHWHGAQNGQGHAAHAHGGHHLHGGEHVAGSAWKAAHGH